MRWALALLLVAGCTRGGVPDATPSTSPPPTPVPTPAVISSVTLVPPPVPTVAPTRTAVDYVFPIAGCRTSYARAHHDYPATDMFARTGCAFVSPVAGRIDEVSYADRWSSSTNRGADRGGLFVSVVGVDGVRYYGSHLSRVAPGIKPGVTVRAGARLGDVGATGSARGTSPHLHFGVSWPSRAEVWWVRRGVVHPWPYLDSWRAGGDRSPAFEVRGAHAAAGTDAPPCTRLC